MMWSLEEKAKIRPPAQRRSLIDERISLRVCGAFWRAEEPNLARMCDTALRASEGFFLCVQKVSQLNETFFEPGGEWVSVGWAGGATVNICCRAAAIACELPGGRCCCCCYCCSVQWSRVVFCKWTWTELIEKLCPVALSLFLSPFLSANTCHYILPGSNHENRLE